MIRRIISTAVTASVITGLIGLYIAAGRWRDLHLAACRRIVELERLLRFERSAVDELAEQVGQERQQAETLGALAKVALRNEVYLGEELKRAKNRERALNLEVAALREMVAPGMPPIDEALLAAAKDSLTFCFCGTCGADRTEEGRASAPSMRRLQEAVERAERVRAGQAETAAPIGEMAVDVVEEPSLEDVLKTTDGFSRRWRTHRADSVTEIRALVDGPAVKCGDCGFSYIQEMYGGPDATCPKCIDEDNAHA